MLGRTLHSVNCHATTETSDMIGGLRPVRGRDAIKELIVAKMNELVQNCPYTELLEDLDLNRICVADKNDSDVEDRSKETVDVDEMVTLARTIVDRRPTHGTHNEDGHDQPMNKRRKLTEASSPGDTKEDNSMQLEVESLSALVVEIEDLCRRYNSLFEWSDGPLVKAMKSGHMLLLDEMSLAEDAVLERLNSVLEPSRLLVLAEKGDNNSSDFRTDDRVIVAHDEFRIFATMNPGGDFGKRELSPALRSRFTEIWVPPVADRADFEVVLARSMVTNRRGESESSVYYWPDFRLRRMVQCKHLW